jgi:hypothetical protein
MDLTFQRVAKTVGDIGNFHTPVPCGPAKLRGRINRQNHGWSEDLDHFLVAISVENPAGFCSVDDPFLDEVSHFIPSPSSPFYFSEVKIDFVGISTGNF